MCYSLGNESERYFEDLLAISLNGIRSTSSLVTFYILSFLLSIETKLNSIN